MAFSDETIKEAWDNAGGECEKCGTSLNWESQGSEGPKGWEAHHKHSVASDGSDAVSNCKILCQPCHKSTHTYGG